MAQEAKRKKYRIVRGKQVSSPGRRGRGLERAFIDGLSAGLGSLSTAYAHLEVKTAARANPLEDAVKNLNISARGTLKRHRLPSVASTKSLGNDET